MRCGKMGGISETGTVAGKAGKTVGDNGVHQNSSDKPPSREAGLNSFQDILHLPKHIVVTHATEWTLRPPRNECAWLNVGVTEPAEGAVGDIVDTVVS